MERLPKEAWYHVLLNQSLTDVLQQCQINKRINTVCKSDQFWEDYLYKHWKVRFQGKDNRKIAIKAEKLLNIIKKNKQLITIDCFWSIIELIPENNFAWVLQGLGIVNFPDIILKLDRNFDLDQYYELNFDVPPDDYEEGVNQMEKEFLGQMLNLINEPTNYIVDKNNIISYPYNVDIDNAIIIKLKHINQKLMNELDEITGTKGSELYKFIYGSE